MYSSFTHCGQRIEADLSSTKSPASKKLLNRPYFGGAIVEFDVYTGHHVDGFLVNNSMAKPLAFVKTTVQKVEVFSVDQGVNRQSLFREAIPEVQRCLNTSNPNRAKPTVLRIKNMLFVESKSYEYYICILRKNPNFKTLSSLASRSSSYGVNYSIGSWSSSTLSPRLTTLQSQNMKHTIDLRMITSSHSSIFIDRPPTMSSTLKTTTGTWWVSMSDNRQRHQSRCCVDQLTSPRHHYNSDQRGE